MLCAVDYIFNLLGAFNCLQPMKKIVFSVASRATGRLQIKPSGSGDENEGLIQTFNEMPAAHFFDGLTFAESANQNYFRCLFF